MSFTNPITGGQGALIRPAIKSPDYVPGVSGWTINRDGTVEFNNGVFRGTVTAAELIASVFGSSLTDPSIWLNQDDENSLRVYDADSNLVCEIGADAGSEASAVFYDPVNGRAISIGQQIQWQQGSPILTPFAALYQTSDAVMFNTILSGGVAFDPAHGALVHVVPGTDTLEDWQAPTMGSGFATGPGGSGSYPPLKFRTTVTDEVRVFGVFHSTTTSPGAVIASGFPPVNQTTLGGVGVAGGVTRFQGASGSIGAYINNLGELRTALPTGFAFAANDSFMVNTAVPLGNIS